MPKELSRLIPIHSIRTFDISVFAAPLPSVLLLCCCRNITTFFVCVYSTMSSPSESGHSRSSSPSKRKRGDSKGDSSGETNPTSISSEEALLTATRPPRKKVENLGLEAVLEESPLSSQTAATTTPTTTTTTAAAALSDLELGAWRESLPDRTDPPPSIKTFPIERDHPLLPFWPSLEKDLLGMLQASAPNAWSGLEVFRRRVELEPVPGVEDTTVVVTASKRDERSWSLLRAGIEDILRDHGQGHLQVELIDGVISRWRSNSDEDGQRGEKGGYAQRPSGGVGIGVSGLDGSGGTLGGYVLLSAGAGKNPVTCALTCHHVLRPTRQCARKADEAAPAYDAELDRLGHHHAAVPFNGLDGNSELSVDQPSVQDHLRTLETFTETLTFYQKLVADLQERMDNGMGSDKVERALQKTREKEGFLEKARDELSGFKRGFGHVLATSGYATAPEGCLLDWVLVAVSDRRVGKNVIPSPPGGFRMIVLPGDVVWQVGQLVLYEDLMMLGNVSGATCGRYNHIKSNVFWNDQTHPTAEHVICGRLSTFGQCGDSGAFVLDHFGRLVGMLVAGQSKEGWGYVTPIEAVFADIERKTGCEVSLLEES